MSSGEAALCWLRSGEAALCWLSSGEAAYRNPPAPHNGVVTDKPGASSESEETQQQRAQRAIEAIFAGGDLQAETLRLSNEFTDRQVERLKRSLRRPRS